MQHEDPTFMREPEIYQAPAQKMAVVHTRGDSNLVKLQAMRSLYGAVYELRFNLKTEGHKFKIKALRARWPDTRITQRDEWDIAWGLPIPEETTSLTQQVPDIKVEIEVWEYGMVAQVLHVGPHDAEPETAQRLHDFITASGYDVAGAREEEYLTTQNAKIQKTVIRYPIRKHANAGGEAVENYDPELTLRNHGLLANILTIVY